MHIVHLIDSLAVGGAQETLRLLIQKSRSHTIHHSVVSISDRSPVYEGELRKLGVESYYLSHYQKGALLFKIGVLIYRFRKELLKREVDILHLHLPGSIAIGVLSSLRLNLKRVVNPYAWKEATPFWVYPMIRLFSPFLDKVQFLDKTQMPWLSEGKFLGYPAGLDLQRPLATNKELIIKEFNLEERSPYLFSVGRFHPDKGHDLALQVLAEVKRQFPRALLFIIGEEQGREAKRLHRLCRKLGLNDSVIFTGYRQDLSSFFALGGFFLRAAINENSNLTNLLAQWYGLICIGFDVSSLTHSSTDFIKDGENGKLVPLGDIKEMAKQVNYFYEHSEEFRRISEQSREYIVRNHDVQKTLVEPVIKAYHELLGVINGTIYHNTCLC